MSAPGDNLKHVCEPFDAKAPCGVDPHLLFQITPQELRRQIHTYGRKAVEPDICPACYAVVRPKKPQGPRLPKGPRTKRPPRPKDTGLGKLDTSPWRKR